MCMMVYLAAAHPLAAIPLDPADPTIVVSPLIAADQIVRKQFRNMHVMFAGAYEGCSCGFQHGGDSLDSSDAAELTLERRSLSVFAGYLRSEIERVGAIEVFACWDGDQASEPQQRRRLSPSTLEKDGFFFLQRELSLLMSDAEVGPDPLDH